MCIMFVLGYDRMEAGKMVRSWAKECDEFLLMDSEAGWGRSTAGTIKHVFLTEPSNSYTEKNFKRPKWNSTIAMWRHVQAHFSHLADWFLFVNDRTYVRMLQLKRFAAAKSQEQPSTSFFLGRIMRHQSGLLINAWNSGTLLNKMALTDLLKSVDGIGLADVQKFRPFDIVRNVKADANDDDDADIAGLTSSTLLPRWDFAAEAVPLPSELVCNGNASVDSGNGIPSTLTRMAACLAARGIKPSNTQDGEGKERFHMINPASVKNLPSWREFHVGALKSRTAPFPFPAGLEGISKQSITFSQTSGNLAAGFHAFLRKTCYSITPHLRFNDGWNDTAYIAMSRTGFKRQFP